MNLEINKCKIMINQYLLKIRRYLTIQIVGIIIVIIMIVLELKLWLKAKSLRHLKI